MVLPEPSPTSPRSKKVNRPTPTQKWCMQRHRPSPAEKARHEPQDKMQHPLSPTKSDDTLPRQQDLTMLLVCTKNIVLLKHLQRQHGSKALSILTYMPKVYLLCGGRDTQEQVLKSLMTSNWPAQCDGGTRPKYMCCDQPRYSCSLRSGPEAEFCLAKASQLLCQHLSHSSLRSCTKCLHTSYLCTCKFSCISYLGSTTQSPQQAATGKHEEKQSLL